jgi:DNA-binding NarL/FixJ family response regulator
VLIMDIAMSGLNGIDASQRIVDRFPDARIIM